MSADVVEKSLLLIINPNSGQKKGRRFLADILDIFCRAGYQCRVYITAKSGDATDYVARYGNEADVVVCAGGDGTLNEVLFGMIKGSIDRPLGYIPCGSTNDAAASMKLSTDIIQAAKDIVEGRPKPIDIGSFNNERCFSYVAGFGAFTQTSYKTPQSVKNVLGHAAYILEGIRDVAQITPVHAKVETVEGIYENDYIFGAVCNTTSVGGVLNLDDELVDMSDGVFEILLVKRPRNIIELNELVLAVASQDIGSDRLNFFKTRKAVITMDDPQDWTLDGEYEKGRERVVIENMHNAVRLIKNNNRK